MSDDTVPLISDDVNYSLESDIRIILVGKTGAGKSAAGNTILGEAMKFKSEPSAKAITLVSERGYGRINERNITVIDTPGFCGSLTEEDMSREMNRCVELSGYGPHAFLLVLRVGRFTSEEKNAVEFIKKCFGEDASIYIIVLFTHADQLETKPLQKYVNESEELLNLIDSCGGRYLSFNNKAMKKCSQVTQLLEMIYEMVKDNGGRHYTHEIFKRAQKKIRNEQLKKRAKEIALGVVSAVGAGAVVAGGVVLGVAEAVIIPAVVVGAGATMATGAAVKLITDKIKDNDEAKKYKVKN